MSLVRRVGQSLKKNIHLATSFYHSIAVNPISKQTSDTSVSDMTANSAISDIILPNLAISYHILCCAEPPEMVIATIDAICAIKTDADEIIILDNNHQQRELYQPVADYCASLDEKRVRFFHYDRIPNHKAGALNVSLSLTDATCSHILVVDSDYQLLPYARDCLQKAVAEFPNRALWQFPQAYRHTRCKPIVTAELNHYFVKRLAHPLHKSHSLSTGTLALLKREALEAIGGWQIDSLTEDAQTGIALHEAGFSTCYIHEVIGQGELPLTVPSWFTQRRRWMYGNAQTVIQKQLGWQVVQAGWGVINDKTTLEDFQQSYSQWVQLTTWLNATAPALALQAVATGLIWLDVFDEMPNRHIAKSHHHGLSPAKKLLAVAITMQYGYLLCRLFRFYGRGSFASMQTLTIKTSDDTVRQNPPDYPSTSPSSLSQATLLPLTAWLMHLNLWEDGALHWLPVLWGQKKLFIVTNKKRSKLNTHVVNVSIVQRAFGALSKLRHRIRPLPKTVLVLHGATVAGLWLDGRYQQQQRRKHKVQPTQQNLPIQHINQSNNYLLNQTLIQASISIITLKLIASGLSWWEYRDSN